jgi:hypothetical protein
MRGTWRSRCASVPKRAMTSATMFVTAIVTAVDAHAARDLHHGERIRHDARLRAAELRGDVDAHEPELGEALQDLEREALLAVELGRDGLDHALGVVARGASG